MTANELIHKMNSDYENGLWPKTLEVDPETYANCCQYVFNFLIGTHSYYYHIGTEYRVLDTFNVGMNNGLMFKNVELILKPTS